MDRFLLSSLLSFFLSCSLFPSLLSALVFSDTACIVFRLLAASRQPSSARYWVSSKCRSVEQLRFDQTTSIGRQPRARGVAMVSRGVKDRELATKTHPPPPRCSPRSVLDRGLSPPRPRLGGRVQPARLAPGDRFARPSRQSRTSIPDHARSVGLLPADMEGARRRGSLALVGRSRVWHRLRDRRRRRRRQDLEAG